jgi:phosphoserine phosphatase RsbU/P
MDAAAMLHEVAAEVRASFPASSITVRTNGDTHGRWDHERLVQAVTNLASNAVHHGAKGAPITVTADGSDSELAISVCNQGPAIPAEQVARIFDGMKSLGVQRAGGDRRHLGLGLYIVDKVVRAHGGSITLDSSAERGTTFTIHLPRGAATEPAR